MQQHDLTHILSKYSNICDVQLENERLLNHIRESDMKLDNIICIMTYNKGDRIEFSFVTKPSNKIQRFVIFKG